jgi:hypothetical protein
MAEVKNAFLKSKMNKDLDSKLIPNGEYRDAQNVQISKSEGDDVGALENVLGNNAIASFDTDPGTICIGYFSDKSNNAVYLFFTNNPTANYSPSYSNYIYYYNINNGTKNLLVSGSFLNFSILNQITGINLLENILFFTDNRNQPRKINVDKAIANPSFYDNEDKISVAKYNPYRSIEVIKETATPGIYETTMKDVFSEYIPINDPSYVTNPYWAGADAGGNPNFAGDPQYLQDKFVRFSYRFKFADGEYSILAPFTQECFIPKQDGYFLTGDEEQTVASTIVEFMENKVNQIDLQIPLPTTKSNLNSDFEITEIDIIYKESDALAVQVVETINIDETFTGAEDVFEYSYLSTKPYKTLPESELIRVYDKVPVKALSQEIISNRIVYGNFQDKHTPPSGINYQVAANEKYDNTQTYSSLSRIEYPNHSLKQNRNYQVGVVLSDKYGRQSTVILSNNKEQADGNFKADTVYLPYDKSNLGYSIGFSGDSLKVRFNQLLTGVGFDKSASTPGTPGLYKGDPTSDDYNPLGWYSYKIVVKQLEQEYYNVYASGAIKGSPYYDTQANPSIPLTDENASFITLLNDNINKVPRDLTEVGPQDRQFRSSVELFGRVENTERSFSNIGNRQYFPGRKSFTTNTIEDLFDLYDTAQFDAGGSAIIPVTSTNSPYYAFYRSESNPFVAEFITSKTTASDQFGVNNLEYTNTRVYEKFDNLSVLETKPTVSRLDIFWEATTTSASLLSELNLLIEAGGSGPAGVGNWDDDFLNEGTEPETTIVQNFYFTDTLGSQISTATTVVTVASIIEVGVGDASSKFNFVNNGDGTYNIETTVGAYFYFGTNGATFDFVFEVDGSQLSAEIFLGNEVPIIKNLETTPPEDPRVKTVTEGAQDILTPILGENGSADPTKKTLDITYNITSQARYDFNLQTLVSLSGEGNFILANNNTEVRNTDSTALGIGYFVLQATDSGGLSTFVNFKIIFGYDATNSNFSDGSMNKAMFGGEGYSAYFANNANNMASVGSDYPKDVINLNAGAGKDYAQGWSGLGSLSSEVVTALCPVNSNYVGNYYNKASSSGLTKGTFYIQYTAINTYNAPTYANHRYGFQYRQNENSTWESCNDIAGQSIQYNGATFLYDGYVTGSFPNEVVTNTDVGMIDTTNSLNPPALSGPGSPNIGVGFSKLGGNASFGAPQFGVVYAFKNIGDYRFLFGNLASTGNGSAAGTGLAQDVPFDLNANLDCNSYGSTGASGWTNNPPITDGNPNALDAGLWWTVNFADFNDPPYFEAPDGRNDLNPTFQASNLFPGIYRYQISIPNRSTAYTGLEVRSFIDQGTPQNPPFTPPFPVNSNFQTVYAAEPLAKYVTQFYTDNTLTTKFTANNGNFYFFQRMQYTRIDDSDPNWPTNNFKFYAELNPEYTVGGCYQTRLSSTGLNLGVNNLGPGGININGTAALPVLNPQRI